MKSWYTQNLLNTTAVNATNTSHATVDLKHIWPATRGVKTTRRKLRGEGSGRIEPSRQLLDDCTHKRNSKRKVGKLIYD